MSRFLARRAAMLVVTLLASSILIFAAVSLAPGDPVSALSGSRTLSPEAMSALRAQYHLDDPFGARYLQWLGDVAHGDLGTSITFRQDVGALIGDRIGVTLWLVVYAGLLIAALGVGLGVLAGLRRGAVDTVVIAGTTVLAAVPSFFAAALALSVFSVGLGWFPAIGAGHGFADGLRHLTLPAFSLALASVAVVARVTRVAVRTEAGREHVQTAVSRGIPYPVLVRRHVLRNAAIPVTTVVGMTLASLFALSAIVEQAFGLNGIGAALVQAASSRDYPVVQGIGLVLVTAFVVTNAIVDMLYAMLDPRVSVGTAAA